MHGQGKMIYADGAFYEGEWSEGLRIGNKKYGFGIFGWNVDKVHIGDFFE